MSRQMKIVLGAVVALAAVAGFWFVALSPKYTEASDLQTQIDTTEAELAQVRQQAATLEADKKTYAAHYTAVARLGKAIPADDDVRSLVVQLDAAAKRSNVDFSAIELDGSGAAATQAAPAAGAATPTQAATATLPPGASVGTAGLPTMPFSFGFSGSFFGLSSFFARVERFVAVQGEQLDVKGRLLAIDGFTLKPHEEGWPLVEATLGATAYLVSADQGASGGATPWGPAGTQAPADKTAIPPAAPALTATSTTGGLR